MFGYARVGTGYITFITTGRGVIKHKMLVVIGGKVVLFNSKGICFS